VAGGGANRSAGRYPDGADTQSNCDDFLVQSATTVAAESAAGEKNIKVASVAGLTVGQSITIGTGDSAETSEIATVGTAGGTTVGTAADKGATVLTVTSAFGFTAGQTITVDSGANVETAVIASVTGGRGGGGGGRAPRPSTITVTAPLTLAHAAGAQVSGTGLTLAAALTKAHDRGAAVCESVPTPGAPNQFPKRKQ
jgi:hypothetical protein